MFLQIKRLHMIQSTDMFLVGCLWMRHRHLRDSDPSTYERLSFETMGDHVRAMLNLQQAGAITFDYGNNLRAGAQE